MVFFHLLFFKNWSIVDLQCCVSFWCTTKWLYTGISGGSAVKNLPTVQETRVWSLGWEDPLEKEIATHCSILARRMSWTDKPGGLHPMGSQRIGHSQATNTFFQEQINGAVTRKQHLETTHKRTFSSLKPISKERGCLRRKWACQSKEESRLQQGLRPWTEQLLRCVPTLGLCCCRC